MDIVEKTRRLKKYEASEAVLFCEPGSSQSGCVSMDFLSPFGPLIARNRISSDLVDHLNSTADSILSLGCSAEFQLTESQSHYGGDERRNYIAGRQAGYINFLIGGKQRFSRSLISFRPVVGNLYIFPGWLLHAAEPFRGSGERRSLAFNAHVS